MACLDFVEGTRLIALNKVEILIEIVCKVALQVTPILFRAKLDGSVRLRMNKYAKLSQNGFIRDDIPKN